MGWGLGIRDETVLAFGVVRASYATRLYHWSVGCRATMCDWLTSFCNTLCETGKSTTLGILSGDVLPTSGQASIAGHDVLTEQVTCILLSASCGGGSSSGGTLNYLQNETILVLRHTFRSAREHVE